LILYAFSECYLLDYDYFDSCLYIDYIKKASIYNKRLLYWTERSATNPGNYSSIPIAGVYFSPKLEKKKVQITLIFGRPMDITFDVHGRGH
jgi:hypothetical protein